MKNTTHPLFNVKFVVIAVVVVVVVNKYFFLKSFCGLKKSKNSLEKFKIKMKKWKTKNEKRKTERSGKCLLNDISLEFCSLFCFYFFFNCADNVDKIKCVV